MFKKQVIFDETFVVNKSVLATTYFPDIVFHVYNIVKHTLFYTSVSAVFSLDHKAYKYVYKSKRQIDKNSEN